MDNKSVFLNVPYDTGYERLFVTLIGSIVSLGVTPKCVLEIPETGKGRLSRIQNLLESCDISIHDLSRVGTPARFNMPFELGLACSFAKQNSSHEIVVLEKKVYRLDRTLSDYKGRDPLIHKGSCYQMVNCILDVFITDNRTTPARSVRRATKLLLETAKEIRRSHRIDNVFHRSAFKMLVAAATDIALDEGLIDP